jgi:hypothetical protein
MRWAIIAVMLARLPGAADAPCGDPATHHETRRVVALRTGGEVVHDAGSRLVAKRDREGPGTLHLRIVERNADRVAPVSARVHLADSRGEPVLASGQPAWRDHFNCDGDVRLELPPGRYTYTIERRPEYRRTSGALTLSAGEVREQEVILRRLIDLASLGWYSERPTCTDRSTTFRSCSAPRTFTWYRSSRSGTRTTTGKIGSYRRSY